MLGLKLTLKFWFFINHLSNHHDLDCHCFLGIAMNHSYILNAMVGIITEYLYSRTNEKQKQILWWSLECYAIIYRKLKLSLGGPWRNGCCCHVTIGHEFSCVIRQGCLWQIRNGFDPFLDPAMVGALKQRVHQNLEINKLAIHGNQCWYCKAFSQKFMNFRLYHVWFHPSIIVLGDLIQLFFNIDCMVLLKFFGYYWSGIWHRGNEMEQPVLFLFSLVPPFSYASIMSCSVLLLICINYRTDRTHLFCYVLFYRV